jgi:hypothetical protein
MPAAYELNQRPPAEMAPAPSRGHPHTPSLLVIADFLLRRQQVKKIMPIGKGVECYFCFKAPMYFLVFDGLSFMVVGGWPAKILNVSVIPA